MESQPISKAPAPAPPMEAELDVTTTDLMEAIAARHLRSPLPPDAFTLDQFRQRVGFGKDRARKALAAEVEAGRLLTKMVPLSRKGGRYRIYYPPPDGS